MYSVFMAQARKNNDLKIAIWSVVVVVLALAVIIVVKLNANSTTAPINAATLAPSSLISKITSLAGIEFGAIGTGTATKLPQALKNAPALTQNNKPEILYIGAEYCPYCATERWPIVVALSRFGSFSKLGLTTSSSTDVYPSTATFAFHGATYSSPYISFVGVEQTTNQPDGSGGYTPLDALTPAEQKLISTYDASPYVPAGSAGSIPFIDFGGKYLITGSTYDPSVLQGKTADQIAGALSQPGSAIAKGALGAANTITAAICQLTNNQPGNVCNTTVIQGIQAKLGQS